MSFYMPMCQKVSHLIFPVLFSFQSSHVEGRHFESRGTFSRESHCAVEAFLIFSLVFFRFFFFFHMFIHGVFCFSLFFCLVLVFWDFAMCFFFSSTVVFYVAGVQPLCSNTHFGPLRHTTVFWLNPRLTSVSEFACGNAHGVLVPAGGLWYLSQSSCLQHRPKV